MVTKKKVSNKVTSLDTTKTTFDTHSYQGWLNSDSFLKRAFAILGYQCVAALLIYIPALILFFIIMGVILFAK